MLISRAIIRSGDYTITLCSTDANKISIEVGDRQVSGVNLSDLLEAIRRAPRGNNHKFITQQFCTGSDGSLGIASDEGKHSLVFDDGESISDLIPIDLSVLEGAIRACAHTPEIKPTFPITPDPYYPRPDWVKPDWSRRRDETPSWPPGTIYCGNPGTAAIPNSHIYINGMRVR